MNRIKTHWKVLFIILLIILCCYILYFRQKTKSQPIVDILKNINPELIDINRSYLFKILSSEELVSLEKKSMKAVESFQNDIWGINDRIDVTHPRKSRLKYHVEYVIRKKCDPKAVNIIMVLSDAYHDDKRIAVRSSIKEKSIQNNNYEYNCIIFVICYTFSEKINKLADKEYENYKDVIRMPILSVDLLYFRPIILAFELIDSIELPFKFIYKSYDGKILNALKSLPFLKDYPPYTFLVANILYKQTDTNHQMFHYLKEHEKVDEQLYGINRKIVPLIVDIYYKKDSDSYDYVELQKFVRKLKIPITLLTDLEK